MAQAYFPTASHVMEKSNSTTGVDQSNLMKVEDIQEAFLEKKNKLLGAIDSTTSILSDLRVFNKDAWVVRYPQLAEQQGESSATRSLSFADDPSFQTNVIVSSRPNGLSRSIALAKEGVQAESNVVPPESTDFNVFRLDLKLGTAHSSAASATTLVSQLEKSSIANLIDERIGTSLGQVDKLRMRVEDTSSKVLVTGDLNAGKSTFVNAILGRSVMPIDQQPCTTAFCEVHDAAENGDQEEVHIVKEGAVYDLDNESTFTRTSVENLEDFIADNEDEKQVLKVYLRNPRGPAESILHNGVVDISLIDAPGLNRDSVKTTALFSRQEEIDVVVFVVSAENHFTLSAKEFLSSASNDKAYVFVVVNKFDSIRNKDKCRRLVLDQIKQLSPRTYEDAKDLVHFVDSASSLDPSNASDSFKDLESALRSFVLTKRTKSKLQPASTYINRLLSDVDLLVSANAIVAQSEVDRAAQELASARPVLERMNAGREAFEDGLIAIEETSTEKARTNAQQKLASALDSVEQGKSTVGLPTYPGLFGVWEWAGEVRKALVATLDGAVVSTENDTRDYTSAGVTELRKTADEHLPEGVESGKRIFMPEVMFTLNRKSKNSKRAAAASASREAPLSERREILDTSFFDLFDVSHHFAAWFGPEKGKQEESNTTALGVASVGLGALTVVGGQAMGARGAIEGFVRISNLIADEKARKWIAPVLGAFTVGLSAYMILELPRTVPRTIGRRLKASLTDEELGQQMWLQVHSERMSRETRKVLRLAAWDQRSLFKNTLDESEKAVKAAEEMEKNSGAAIVWFKELQGRTGEVLETIREV